MSLDEIEEFLASAIFWGLELDTRYRVAALTFEPARMHAGPEPRNPGSSGGPNAANDITERGDVETGNTDVRLQALVYPVSTILAVLREDEQQLTFEAEQLIDVSAVFGGSRLPATLFGAAEPRPGQWAPMWSLEGRSTAPDGRRNNLQIALQADTLELQVFLRFDEIQVRRPDQSVVFATDTTIDPFATF